MPICNLDCLSHLGCNSWCIPHMTGAGCTRAPSDIQGIVAINNSHGRTRAPSDLHGRPSCTNCLPAPLDVSNACEDFAKYALENTSCMDLIVPAVTTAAGYDGARSPICNMGCLSHLSFSSRCAPDVKSGDSQAAMWPRPLTSTTWLKKMCLKAPARTCAAAMHAGPGCAREASGQNARPR